MGKRTIDIIPVESAATLAGLFRERVRRSSDVTAYRHFDERAGRWADTTWAQMRTLVARWQAGLLREGLAAGDRVAVMLRNCPQWICLDQAALGLGLVVVPLYAGDRPESCAYILEHSGSRLLLIEGPEQWRAIREALRPLRELRTVLTLKRVEDPTAPRLRCVEDWLPAGPASLVAEERDPRDLATIVYTSGTTGRQKGVMLSHHNILSNAASSLQSLTGYREDVFLSFLPLSHMLERMAGYYLSMMAGAVVAFARSPAQLAEDLLAIHPTVLIAVPRIFERVYGRLQAGLRSKSPAARHLFALCVELGWQRFLYQQRRAPWSPSLLAWPLLHRAVGRKILLRLGGRLRIALCGGAPLTPEIARTFIGLGLTMGQGYGLTEASPVVSVFRLDQNEPASVGAPLDGLEVRTGGEDELLVRGPNVMLGYWRDPQATAEALDSEGWLHTGDQVRFEDRQIYITGRLKDIIVLANGEKLPPADMEMAILRDPLFEQVMIVGEGRPYLAALVVLSEEPWRELASELGTESLEDGRLERAVLDRINHQLSGFPGYARVRRAHLGLTSWSLESGLLTPTMKLRRGEILQRFASDIERLYEGHRL